jgi:TPR repeat protein
VGERQRQRGEVLARQLASAQKEVETLTARVTAMTDAHTEAERALQGAQASVAEQRQALDQERRRGDALARELASAREELETRKAAAKAADDAVQTAQALAIEHRQVGERERQRGEVLARQLASAHKEVETLTARIAAMSGIREQIALWVKRGEDFAAAGDLVSARLVFQRAAETGDAKAALMLAETYDPNVLDRLRARGVAPDIAMARLWYKKAKDLGSPEAQRRLERLDQPN